MFSLSVLKLSMVNLTFAGFEILSFRLGQRLPLTLLSFGFNGKYKSFNLNVLGMYVERDVEVIDWDGNYQMKWNFFWMGLRKCTLDYLRGEKENA